MIFVLWLGALPARIWRACLTASGLRTWAIILAGPPLTAMACWIVWIVWKGPWAIERQGQQLDILGWALWGTILLLALILVALTGLGVAASINKSGLSLTVKDDDDRPGEVTVSAEATATRPE